MIKFFRKIRQRLITENKFSKYLLYAIGEIILVVMGILIALALNSDIEKQKELDDIYIAVQTIRNDIANDLTQLENYWLPQLMEEKQSRKRLEEFLRHTAEIEDTLQFVTDIVIISTYFTFDRSKTAMENLINTGGLKLIKYDKLLNELLSYKTEAENINEFDVIHRAFYLELFGDLGPKMMNGYSYIDSFKFINNIEYEIPDYTGANAIDANEIHNSGYLREFLIATSTPFVVKKEAYSRLKNIAEGLLRTIDEIEIDE